MVDATKRDSSKRISEDDKRIAVIGPFYKIKMEREIRARIKQEKLMHKKKEELKIQ